MKSDSRALLIFLVVVAALVLVGVGLFVGLVNPKFGSPYLLLFLLLIPAAGALLVWFERRRQRRAAVWASPAAARQHGPRARRAARDSPRPAAARGQLAARRLRAPRGARDDRRNPARRSCSPSTSRARWPRPTSSRPGSAPPTRFSPSSCGHSRASYRLALVTFSSGAAVTVCPHLRPRPGDRRAAAHGAARRARRSATASSPRSPCAEHAFGTVTTGGKHPPAAVLVVSDGGQNAGKRNPGAGRAAARKAGIPVSALALGTPAGAVTQKLTVQGSSQKFTETTQVPVEPATMKQIAAASGGLYFQDPRRRAQPGLYESREQARQRALAARDHRRGDRSGTRPDARCRRAFGLWFRRIV